jgi:hypothetical protein
MPKKPDPTTAAESPADQLTPVPAEVLAAAGPAPTPPPASGTPANPAPGRFEQPITLVQAMNPTPTLG